MPPRAAPPAHEYLILNDWIKIVDFLRKAYFWLRPESPLHVCISVKIQEVSQVNFKNVSNYIVLHIGFKKLDYLVKVMTKGGVGSKFQKIDDIFYERHLNIDLLDLSVLFYVCIIQRIS